jgi:hypothetical protein
MYVSFATRARAEARYNPDAITPRPLSVGVNGQVIHYLGTLVGGVIYCADCLDVLANSNWAKFNRVPDPALDADRITTDNVAHTDICGFCERALNGK